MLLLSSADFFFSKKKDFYFSKRSFMSTSRVTNSFHPGQDRRVAGSDLDPNCLQILSAEDNSLCQQGKINSLSYVTKHPRKAGFNFMIHKVLKNRYPRLIFTKHDCLTLVRTVKARVRTAQTRSSHQSLRCPCVRYYSTILTCTG